mgnify:CR=1 FL=1
MDEQVFKQRTQKLALRVIELVEELPKRLFAIVVSEMTGQSKIQNLKSKIVGTGLSWLSYA